jgi:ATP-dependent Clp protease adaptor protein ClpS
MWWRARNGGVMRSPLSEYGLRLRLHALLPIHIIPSMSIEFDTLQEISEQTAEEEAFEPLYRVLIHNDDVTPYDFVVLILQKIFELDAMEAEHVTFVAHVSGLAYVATLPLSEAQKRVGKAHFAATLEGFPLHFTIEPE